MVAVVAHRTTRRMCAAARYHPPRQLDIVTQLLTPRDTRDRPGRVTAVLDEIPIAAQRSPR